MTEHVRGNPERLEEYTEETRLTLGPLRVAIEEYAEAIRAFNRASNDLSASLSDHSDHYHAVVAGLERIDAGPAAFAWALRRLDRSFAGVPAGAVLSTTDIDVLHRLIDARLANPSESDDLVWARAVDAETATAEDVAAALRRIVDAAQRPDALGALESWALSTLRLAVETLRRRNGDVAYLTRLYEALGPERTASLPAAIGLVVSGQWQFIGGESGLDVRAAVAAVSETLAAASPQLDERWRDALFAAGTDDGRLHDGFALLFSSGRFDPKFAVPAGQLGIDVIDGVVWNEAVGSDRAKALYEAIGHANPHWSEAGAALISAAARTPQAANMLLRADGNARRITSDEFGWRQHPDLRVVEAAPWWSIGGPVGELLTSGTVVYASHDLAAARTAATQVVQAAAPDRDPDDGRPWYAGAGRRVQGWITGAGAEARDFFAGVARGAGKVVRGISEQLRQLDDRVVAQFHATQSVVDRIAALVGRLAVRFIDTVGELSRSLAPFVGGSTTGLVDAVQTTADAVTSGVDTTSHPSPRGEDQPDVLDRVVGSGKQLATQAREAGGNLVHRARGAAGKFLGKARDWASDKIRAIKDRIVGWLSKQVQEFLDRIGSLLERLKQKWANDIWPAIDRWVDKCADVLKIISSVLKWISVGLGVLALFLWFTGLGTLVVGAIALAIAVVALGIDALLAATGNGSWEDVGFEAVLTLVPFGKIFRPFKPLLKKIPFAWLGRQLGRLATGAKGLISRARRWIEETLPAISRWLGGLLSRAGRWIEEKLQFFWSKLSHAIQLLVRRVQALVARVSEALRKAFVAIRGRIRETLARLRKHKRTTPTGPKDGKPTGRKTKLGPRDRSPENVKAIERENESAEVLSEAGYRVEQNPVVPPPKKPDYKIEGEIFDNLAPSTSNIRNIRTRILEKVASKQADRIVLNLADTNVSPEAIRHELYKYLVPGLKEVIVITKDGKIMHIYP